MAALTTASTPTLRSTASSPAAVSPSSSPSPAPPSTKRDVVMKKKGDCHGGVVDVLSGLMSMIGTRVGKCKIFTTDNGVWKG